MPYDNPYTVPAITGLLLPVVAAVSPVSDNTFQPGIIYGAKALDGTDGSDTSTTFAEAIQLGRNQRIDWWAQGQVNTFGIVGEGKSTDTPMFIVYDTAGIGFELANGTKVFNIDPAGDLFVAGSFTITSLSIGAITLTGVGTPAHGVLIGEGSSPVIGLTGAASSVLQFNGTSADPTASTTPQVLGLTVNPFPGLTGTGVAATELYGYGGGSGVALLSLVDTFGSANSVPRLLFRSNALDNTLVTTGIIQTETTNTANHGTLAADLSFYTGVGGSLTEWMRIRSNGNIGVHSTSAEVPLAVTGSSGGYTGGGSSGVFQVTTGTGADSDNKLLFGVLDGTYCWIQGARPGIATNNLVLQPGGGLVGVNNTAPVYQLDVEGSNGSFIAVRGNSSTSSAGIDFLRQTTVTGSIGVAGAAGQYANIAKLDDLVLRAHSTDGTMIFATGTGDVAQGMVSNSGELLFGDAINSRGVGSTQFTWSLLASTAGSLIITDASATSRFTAAMQGRHFQITSGHHFIPGYYVITAVNNANSISVNLEPTDGSNASTGSGQIWANLTAGGLFAGADYLGSANGGGFGMGVNIGAGSTSSNAALTAATRSYDAVSETGAIACFSFQNRHNIGAMSNSAGYFESHRYPNTGALFAVEIDVANHSPVSPFPSDSYTINGTSGGDFSNGVAALTLGSGTTAPFNSGASAALYVAGGQYPSYTNFASTAGSNIITSASGGFTGRSGEIVWISGGTNFVPGSYLITLVNSDTSITVNIDPTNGSNASGGTGAIFGGQGPFINGIIFDAQGLYGQTGTDSATVDVVHGRAICMGRGQFIAWTAGTPGNAAQASTISSAVTHAGTATNPHLQFQDTAMAVLSQNLGSVLARVDSGGGTTLFEVGPFPNVTNTNVAIAEVSGFGNGSSVNCLALIDSFGEAGSQPNLLWRANGSDNAYATIAGIGVQVPATAVGASLSGRMFVNMVSGGTTYNALIISKYTASDPSVLAANGSISATASDQNFGAGGNRAVMDMAGGTARIGSVNGGGGATTLNLMAAATAVFAADGGTNNQFPTLGTTASPANAFLDSGASNNLLRSTSLAAFKVPHGDVPAQRLADLWKLRPQLFTSRHANDNPERLMCGLYLEDVEPLFPELVHGQSVHYALVGALLVGAADDRFRALEARLASLEARTTWH